MRCCAATLAPDGSSSAASPAVLADAQRDAGLAGHQIAWMTGTSAFSLSDSQKGALGDFLDAGGGTIMYVPFGMHDTLDGHTAYKALSYMPATSLNLAANIILFALTRTPMPQ